MTATCWSAFSLLKSLSPPAKAAAGSRRPAFILLSSGFILLSSKSIAEASERATASAAKCRLLDVVVQRQIQPHSPWRRRVQKRLDIVVSAFVRHDNFPNLACRSSRASGESRDKERGSSRGSGVDLRRAESRRGGEASARSVEPPLESQDLGVFSVSARPEPRRVCRAERYRHSYSLARAGSLCSC